MYYTWWRMPEGEWEYLHKFKSYYLLGQLDMSREVLLPKEKTIDGVKVAGFDVINPLYCYEGGRLSLKNLYNEEDPTKIDRAAVIIHRGWIPADYRDRRSRPDEKFSRQLVKVTGTWRRGKDVHDYKIPNDPNSNEWHNLCLEDIGMFWDLPNYDDAKYYYFQLVDLP